MTRKKPVFDDRCCVSCGICAQACPVSALSMTRMGRSGRYPNVFPELLADACTGCGLCARSCPMDVIGMEDLP